MYNTKQTILLILCILLGHTLYSQSFHNKLEVVTLTIKHDRKIPYHKVRIHFDGFLKKNVEVSIRSKPLNDDKRWAYSKIDTNFIIEREKYNVLTDSLLKFDHQKIINHLDGYTMEGYNCKLQFGGRTDFVVYSGGSPSQSIESREFFDICAFILDFVGLDSFEIMGKPITEEEHKARLEAQKKGK